MNHGQEKKADLVKPSGIDWIGDIPKDWISRRGKFLFRSGKRINRGLKCENILSLTMKGVIFRSELGEGGLLPNDYSTFQIFEKDDIVFKLIDLENYKTSRVGLVPERGIMSSAYIRIFPKFGQDISVRFFYYYYYNLYLEGIYNFLGMGVRSTMNNLDLLEMGVIIPPKETQEKIVAFLDEKTGAVDAVIAKKKQLIELLKEKRSSIITHAVTKGLDPNARMKPSGIDWIGDIPSDWGVYPGFYLIRETKRKNFGLVESNLLSLSYGNIIRKEDKNFGLTPESFETYQIVNPGQIIFRLTDLQNDKKSLRSGLVKEKGIITSAYVAIEATAKVSPEFLNYLYRSYDHVKVFYTLGAGVRQSSDFPELKRTPLLLPKRETQEKIVAFLDEKTSRIDDATAKIEQQIRLLNEYRASLIYHCVTGKTIV